MRHRAYNSPSIRRLSHELVQATLGVGLNQLLMHGIKDVLEHMTSEHKLYRKVTLMLGIELLAVVCN